MCKFMFLLMLLLPPSTVASVPAPAAISAIKLSTLFHALLMRMTQIVGLILKHMSRYSFSK